ncbi:MAG: DUF983 domain-containing protein [Chitinophagaceae bacterium]
MSETKSKPAYLLSVLGNKCPRCREGHLFISKNPYKFKNGEYMKMYDRCPVCGQPTDIEVGFYYGTSYVSYLLTVVFSAISFVAWWLILGFSIDDNRIFWWLGLNAFVLILLLPLFMRMSRSLWISWFVKYDPDWKTNPAADSERIVKEHMQNW